ncbi:redox-regulated ATPase YchF [Mesorhizobium captivum]|uniref:redox-regulated ATPase YchF n=1 Tax=Mesorhizobium captivum TaxID=3072319 RepID=UPI002A2464AD|nr:redox-regulated ATPase YchF [Mesorhizobium sp. VK23E]MDX8514204.1 redox-regulated ATPase YchF [Mesorhizobium sp. VK23E]
MGFKCGIVGLPNVGKSTLFNALTRTAAAQAANYPFCTIEPNTGEVAVPDPRLQKIAAIGKSKEIIPTRISFVDIAGLVRGASKGEGLGNQFLANIREVDAIVHVLRCFEDDDITHVEGRIDPVADAETVETELMLADLESLERRIVQFRKRAASKDKEAMTVLPMMEAALELLQAGKPTRFLLNGIAAEDLRILQGLNLLTSHPVLYVCNVAEADAATGNEHTQAVEKMAAAQGAGTVVISAAIEAEVAQLSDEEEMEFLASIGLDEPSLNKVIRAGYELLHLITYFTVGPKETRAWTIHKGDKAPQAAGVIHTDFERGFIRAQTISYNDFVTLGGEVAAKEAGKARDEGKEYVVQDGDIMLFKFNT